MVEQLEVNPPSYDEIEEDFSRRLEKVDKEEKHRQNKANMEQVRKIERGKLEKETNTETDKNDEVLQAKSDREEFDKQPKTNFEKPREDKDKGAVQKIRNAEAKQEGDQIKTEEKKEIVSTESKKESEVNQVNKIFNEFVSCKKQLLSLKTKEMKQTWSFCERLISFLIKLIKEPSVLQFGQYWQTHIY